MGGRTAPTNPRDRRWRMQIQGVNDDRRARVAALKVQGLSSTQIRVKLEEEGRLNPVTGKVWSMGQITNDLKALTIQWREQAFKDTDEWKRVELEKIDQIEREAWSAWNRGIGKKQRTTQEKITGGKSGAGSSKASIVTEDLNGDPRYLAVLLDCQNRRAKLMGLDAALKQEHSGPGGKPIELSDSERASKIEALILAVNSKDEGE